jgi:hypothetical protein
LLRITLAHLKKVCAFTTLFLCIKMSHLQNKSEMLREVAALLHSKSYYPAVAHSAYYSCFQLLKHIWLYSMKKNEAQLRQELRQYNQHARATGAREIGSHEFLINKISKHIIKASTGKAPRYDFHKISGKIIQLKRLRTSADYDDTLFDGASSAESLSLSNDIVTILKKY